MLYLQQRQTFLRIGVIDKQNINYRPTNKQKEKSKDRKLERKSAM